MKDLAALQRAFQRHVYRPARAMERAVLATPRAGAARRLSIYADGYHSRLVDALANDYPAMRALLGEGTFNAAMREYVVAHPSRCANLRWYGGGLARFLARSPRWRTRPVLGELAAFEWALGLAFDAGDAPWLEAEQVARIPAGDWPDMRFALHPSARQLKLRSNAPRIWQWTEDRGRKPKEVLFEEPVAWLVWRKEQTPFYRVLAPDEAWALAAIGRGRSFGAVCNGLRGFAGAAGAAQRGAQLLRNWIAEELICAADPAR